MNLSDVDRRILNVMGDHGGECPQAVVVSSMLPDVNMTYVYGRIKRMQAGGLIDKTGPDNGRTVTLTKSGKAALREA